MVLSTAAEDLVKVPADRSSTHAPTSPDPRPPHTARRPPLTRSTAPRSHTGRDTPRPSRAPRRSFARASVPHRRTSAHLRFFFFNYTAPPEIYPLPLPGPLPI